jgi:hypothetical protein
VVGNHKSRLLESRATCYFSSFHIKSERDRWRRGEGTYEISKTLGLIAMNQGVEKARGRERGAHVEGVER